MFFTHCVNVCSVFINLCWDLCQHGLHENSSWEPCLTTGGLLSDIIDNDIDIGEPTSKPNNFNLPKHNFNPIDSNSLPLVRSDIKIQHKLPPEFTTSNTVTKTATETEILQTTRSPLLTTTPGSIPSSPSWSFPTEGNQKPLKTNQIVFNDHTSSVYFDPSFRKVQIFEIFFSIFLWMQNNCLRWARNPIFSNWHITAFNYKQ